MGKIHPISVEEIRKYEKRLYQSDVEQSAALLELAAYVKEACISNAYKLGDLVKVAQALINDSISDRLRRYLSNTPTRVLKKKISDMIVESYGDCGYSVFRTRPGWEFSRSRLLLISRRHYYYVSNNFVNLHRLKDVDLPLYVNHVWDTPEEKELYLDKMRNMTGDA